jgi:hypothetical protein
MALLTEIARWQGCTVVRIVMYYPVYDRIVLSLSVLYLPLSGLSLVSVLEAGIIGERRKPGESRDY